ncbi:relaxase/mobilization nuclease domain-containing protein [Chryseosolibacter indicus]|uniref:Relaxase/mobilization nuclease domain-containing protein n=1 Tax=Chryseosolibacter indicus TaxID=2782351 RepID=A0ABS5VWR9_9BACT|nr:relaxase/mobilization nuclease domain-containing protein [Chryseosolibacter indicus]MBT1705864.1 relaxase/mobilization nuclease domain-containing protein [Chryseosolibacter indicus]
MVAKVICGKNIKGAVAYNELKVKEGVAECIHSNKFGMDATELTLAEKVNRFRLRMDLNKNVRTNAVHISLNFDQSEKLTVDDLRLISDKYMELLGFSEQPFLVYQHRDAAHPHVHIVTTNIGRDGKRIDLHNIGKVKSEYARKMIEAEFNLVKAESIKKATVLAPILAKAFYGKTETKRAISNVVREVTRSYKFTSLHELNAVLKQFNVVADRGYEGTRMYERKGLVYSILDGKGNKIGVPVKASTIYGKPTLKYLEKQFRLNETLRRSSANALKQKIDESIHKFGAKNLDQLKNMLSRFEVVPVIRANAEGKVYGLTYVDNELKVVFNGSDLGKGYSVKGVSERMQGHTNQVKQVPKQFVPLPELLQQDELSSPHWLKALTDAEKLDHSNPNQIKRKRRKKKQGRSL